MANSEKQDKYLHKALKEPPLKYQRDGQLTLFSEDQLAKGQIVEVDVPDTTEPRLFYQHPNGAIYIGDSIRWLASLPEESVDLILADPPYNIKKAEWDTFESQQAYVNWSLKWIKEAARVLTPAGTLYVCGFSEILADIKLPALQYFAGCRWLV